MVVYLVVMKAVLSVLPTVAERVAVMVAKKVFATVAKLVLTTAFHLIEM
jgi:hypothetical protein